MKKFTHFLFYNNTIPIVFSIIFLGAGATFAASPEARQAVVSSNTKLTSVDNAFLLNSTINDTSVSVVVNSVTEDMLSYFVGYTLNTIDVDNGVWKPISKSKVLTIQKDALTTDLGLYISKELHEIHYWEVQRLKDTQIGQRTRGITPKIISTEYTGLVGSFLDPKQEILEGYMPLYFEEPVITNPLTEAQIKAQQKEQAALQKAKTFVVGEREVVVEDIVPDEEPEPQPDQDPIPAEEPVPDTDPLPEPTPEPSPEPVPEITPEPTPAPEPEQVVEPEPTPAPEPTPEPEA